MMATAGPPNTSSFLPLLETLEDGTTGQSEQTDAYLTIANRLSGEEGRQFLPAVEKDFSRLGKVILTHTSSSNAELSQAALQALGFCVYHSQVVSGIFAAQILSALCSLVTKSTDKNTCTRALWVISKQSFPADVVPTLLAALETVWNREDIQSTVMEHEALNVIIRLLEQVPTLMCDGAVRWAKLIVPLVVHSASKVRLRAAAALEMGMPLLLAKQMEVAAIIEPMMSTKLIPELQKLFMSKNETNVLKLWPLFVKLLGKLLHKGGPFINSLLHLEELGFRSSSPTIKKIAFIAWKSLIDNFALNPDILCSSKRMKLLMQPLTSIHVRTEALLLTKVEVWWYLIVQLGPNLSSNFDQVSVPLLQATIGSDSPSVPNTPSRAAAQNGVVTPSTPKSGWCNLCSFNTSASTPRMGLNSSMQLPASFSSIQQLGLEMLLHYFLGPEVVAAAAKNKLVLSLEPLTHPLLSGAPSFMKHAAVLISTMRESFINAGKDAPEPLLAVIWTSLVRFVSLAIESAGGKKERQGSECLTLMLQALESVVSSEALPADRVLVLLEATVKGLPPRVLGSASYQVGKMDVLNGTPALFVILLLFNNRLPAYLEHDSRFFQCLQALVSCGLSGPTSPLAFAEAVLGVMSGCAASLQNKELLWRMWSLLVGPLTDTITQSNEVNQGDALEHNFSAMHSALMFPITHLLQQCLLWPQASQKSLLSSWSKLYRVFARCAALVVTAEENICCEELCVKMAAAADREALMVPSTLSAVSSILQVMVECVDFSPYTPHFQQKLKSPHTPVNWTRKRSKALGNLSAFLSLLVQSLQAYLEAPEAAPDATPLALLSIVSTLFANLVLANAVSEVLGALVQPLALLYKRAVGGDAEFSPQLQGKLEKLLCEVLGCLQSRSTLAYDDELLALLSPLLCVVFPHKNKHLRSAVAQFWNATFANTVSLAYPEELRPVLSQVKQKTPIILPGFEAVGVPDELSETYSSESSQLEPKLSGMPISSAGKRDSMLRAELKDRTATKTAKPVPMKLDFGSPKPPRRDVLEEEASIDFVFIPPEAKERVLTEHQKEVKRTKRVDIPAMYNNLDASQDTTVFSQYTQNQDDSLEDAEILCKETQDYASPKNDEKMEEESIPGSADVFLEEPTERTEDMDVESKDSESPNTSASSDLVSGTPQKPSSRRQSFITLEKYAEGKPASPSIGSSFTGPLAKTSNSQGHSSEKNILSPEASQTSIEPNSQGPTPSETIGPGSESPRRPKESRTRSEPVRLIERMQSDSAEEEDVIPDTQTKEEDKESTSYSEEINSSSQDEESETVLDDSQSSQTQTPSGEPRRSRRHRIRPQLPVEDPDDREAKYTHVKRRRSGEDAKSESSNLIKLYSLSEDLLGSPERKRRSTSGQTHRKRNEVSKVSKEGGDAEKPKEGSSQTDTADMVDLSQKDDPYSNTDSQTVVPLAQTEKSEEVKSEGKTEQGEKTVIDNSSQEDSQATPSSSDSQIRRRSRRSKAAETEDKDDSINSSGRLTRSQTSTPVNQPEAGVGGRTRRSKLESSQSLTPEGSQSLDSSGSGSSQGKGRLRSSRSSAPSVETPESESSEVLVNAVRKKRGRKLQASLKSPLPLETKEEMLEDASQNLETQSSLEESLETRDSEKSGSKTEPNEEESESPMITETPADLPLEMEDPKKAESEEASQDTRSLSTTKQRDSNSEKDSLQEVEVRESSVFGDAPAQDSCLPAEEKLPTSETSEEKAEKVSETGGVTEKQEESNSDQQDLPAPPSEEPPPEELQQSQMECAQITEEEEEPSATHQVSEASAEEDITLQDNEDGQPETSEDKLEEAPATETSGAAGLDCTTAASSQAAAQDSPVKQKDLEALTEPEVGQSPSNGRLKGTWSPSASPSTSILKKGQKRPLEVETTSPLVKSRRVSFANPIQQQETADDIDRRSPALRTSSPRRSKGCNVAQQKHITTPTKGVLVLSPRNIHSPSYRSSKKCLISEMTQEPRAVPRDCIYPSLVGCSAPVEAVLSQISSTMWSRGFGQLIRARNVKSVGDLCALTPSEIKTLPIRSPKISNVKKALKIYEQQRKGRADELKSFDETERMTSEVEEAASPQLVDEPLPPDATAEQQDGERRPEVAAAAAVDPATELAAAVEALVCSATPLELSRCSPQQLLQMHEQLGGMMRGIAVELQTRLCHADDKHRATLGSGQRH
uniref:Replication timing regulatory factor 1 n=1 Tax=Poecilia latipinna TaxID=48699 RepID=A0A3B3VPA5_9TELE